MTDQPPSIGLRSLAQASQIAPPVHQRTAAWQTEFARTPGAFRSAFQHTAIGMAIVDLDGRFLKVNGSLCRIVGYREEELLATDFQSITHPDDLESDVRFALQLLAGEIDHYDMEKRYVHKQGGVIWVQLSGSVVRDESGQPFYFIAQVQDITARKSAEAEAARRLRQVERLTHTVPALLRALDATPAETLYGELLRIIMNSFNSAAGLFLRFDGEDALVGPYLCESSLQDVRCLPPQRCDLWEAALSTGTVVTENSARPMGCGRVLTRSLVGPILHNGTPLGLFHLGDSGVDYDDEDGELLSRITHMIAPALLARMKRGALTARESEVMDMVVSGMTQKQIATALGITVQTAAKHRAKVLEKLNIHNDVELVHLAMQMRSPSVANAGWEGI